MSFISVADEAIEYFDDQTWKVFNAFGQELLEKVKKSGRKRRGSHLKA